MTTELTRERKTDERRRAVRHDVWQFSTLYHSRLETPVELMDISVSGANLKVRQGWIPEIGSEAELELLNNKLVPCRTMWINGTSIGVEFTEPALEESDITGIDHLGSRLFRLILRHQRIRQAF